ncbi:MAG TPA: plasmid partitioning protein RepB C-terminal domain-containing protein [Polyangiaceae bacterium]|jgi:ParB family chromosome partitioning protein
MTTVRMIPIDKVHILNPRARGKAKFKEIVANISKVGLRKPITVSVRGRDDDSYDLVCGQGRLEAYQALGQTEVPALVIDVPREDRFIMSLVENIARRKHTTMEFVREIAAMRERGDSVTDIATKVDMTEKYVRDLLRLHKNGEERLIKAAEKGLIPIAVAVMIAQSDDADVQRGLTEAYESGQLRGRALLKARALIEERRARGKTMRGGSRRERPKVSTEDLVKGYRRETQRQQLLVKKARICEERLLFVTSTLKQLLADEDFINLLRAERLDALPKYLAEHIGVKGS